MSREAMQKALDAMERYEYAEARVTLRAALEEPVQPVAWIDSLDLARIKDFDVTVYGRDGFDRATPLYAAPPASEPAADRDRLISLLHRCFQMFVDKHDGECAGAMEQGEIGCSCGNDALMQDVGNAIGIELMDTPASEPAQPVITPELIDRCAQRLASWDDGCVWPDSWGKLEVAQMRKDAEKVLREAFTAAPQGYVLVPVEPMTEDEVDEIVDSCVSLDGTLPAYGDVVRATERYIATAAKKGGE